MNTTPGTVTLIFHYLHYCYCCFSCNYYTYKRWKYFCFCYLFMSFWNLEETQDLCFVFQSSYYLCHSWHWWITETHLCSARYYIYVCANSWVLATLFLVQSAGGSPTTLSWWHQKSFTSSTQCENWTLLIYNPTVLLSSEGVDSNNVVIYFVGPKVSVD